MKEEMLDNAREMDLERLKFKKDELGNVDTLLFIIRRQMNEVNYEE